MAKQTASSSDSATHALPAEIAALSYESALAQLEALLEQIENGSVGLAESLEAHGRAELLLKHCRELLDRSELRVRQTSAALEAETLRAASTSAPTTRTESRA
ncbi:MAG: exodeoxyribonuclease VII small subunit [Phycisphaerales bacterium]|nr:exodeoxyribonuclease VII small subunit [Phycisphaerales bacterium]